MYLYNTLTRAKDELKPVNPSQISIYSCGPTVYWNQHIGNMYAYIHWDALVRAFKYLGFPVKWVMNITDVGHMTSDQDSGEDKMEKGAKRENLTVWQIADKYIAQFKDSLSLLNIATPDILCRATEHIEDQISLIKKIESRGFTYRTKTGLVFDTSKFPGYSNFAKLDLEKQQAGARVEVDPDKKSPWDFLLWVTNQPNHLMQWDSPWGRGFPGWHIECTAMSVKYLGERFDIHTGGTEHIPVHHTNEIAQGYGAFGHQTANFWVHNAWLSIKGEKASKSLGNFLTARDLVEKGYDPLAFRYLALTSHYRQGLDFTWEGLNSAQTALNNLKSLMVEWQGSQNPPRTTLSAEKLDKLDNFRAQFKAALEDNLSLPKALAIVWSAAKSNLPPADKRDLLLDFDEVLGLKLNQAPPRQEIPDALKQLADQRQAARTAKDFTKADAIRKQIEAAGWLVEDTPSGPKLKPKTPEAQNS